MQPLSTMTIAQSTTIQAYQLRDGASSAACSKDKKMTTDYGYLQHGEGSNGPFRTERVKVRHLFADNWEAYFEGKWRKVHIQVKRTFIIYQGERITIQIDGV